MPIFDHFRLLAPYYDRWMSAPSPERWQRALDLPAATLLLDVGGGTGRAGGSLASSVAAVVVVDISHDMLLRAVSRPGVLPVQAMAEHLPFADGAFDRMLMVDALHHVIDTHASMREMLRVLAPGGRLLIEEPDWRRFSMRLLAWVEKLALMRSHPEQPETILRLARQAGARARCLSPRRNVTWVVIDRPRPPATA